jgi:hypothetical protein
MTMKSIAQIPEKNQCVIDTIIKYGPVISPTYNKAVCTELVIKVIEKIYPLDKTDKSRIRIIADENIFDLLESNSSVIKGVYYALTAKGIGTAIENLADVLPGDFVQFWVDNGWWGHCGVVKSINYEDNTMDLYSSYPSTNGYGIQTFPITKYCYFVRLK